MILCLILLLGWVQMSKKGDAPDEIELAIYEKLIGYRSDPIGFMTQVLDVRTDHVWSKMIEVAESVRDHQLTAVPAGHDVSKTYVAARTGVWFKTCFQPSTVITTSPSEYQLKHQLWREIHTCYSGAKVPLGGNMLKLLWDCKPPKETLESLPPHERGQWEKNFIIGFTTSPDTASAYATRMQGWHNKWLLVVLDEVVGIHPLITKAVIESLVVNKRCKVLAIGNPTDPYCWFADICKPDSGWNVVKISVRDTPNYIEDAEVIPTIAGRDYEEGIIKHYGVNSNEHLCRCLGEFPTYAQGVIWGPEIGQLDKNKFIGDYPWDSSAPVYSFGDYGIVYTAIGYFQFIRDTIRMIDYFYDDVGIGIPAICKMWDDLPYNFPKNQGHWGGPDMHPKTGSNRKSLATGRAILTEFKRLGHPMSVCDKHGFDEGIKMARDVFRLIRINSLTCMDFVDAIRQYKFKKNLIYSTDDKPAYSKDPEPTPSCHPADMWRHMTWIYRNQLIIEGTRIGVPEPLVPGYAFKSSDSYNNWNVLTRRKT